MRNTDLSQWLATLDAATLERLITLRSDVLAGAPVRDLDDLAERLAQPESVVTVLRELPTPAVQVLESVVALGSGARPERLTALLDPGARDPETHTAAVERWIEYLVALALIWPDDDGRIHPNPGLPVVLNVPLALGPPAAALVPQVTVDQLQKVVRRWGITGPTRKADLVVALLEAFGDPGEIRRMVGHAPSGVAGVIMEQVQHAVAGMHCIWVPDVAIEDTFGEYAFDREAYVRQRAARSWAIENGLGFGASYDPFPSALPSEVVLALAGPQLRVPFDPEPPHLASAPVAPEQAGAAASGAVTELLGTVMATLEHLGRSPVPLVKAGGVGVREIARLGKAVGGSPADVRLTLELAAELDLVAITEAGLLSTGAEFTAWRTGSPARRVADLVATWAVLGHVPTADRDEEGKAIPALSRAHGSGGTVLARSALMALAGRLPEATGVTSLDALADAVAWHLPIVTGLIDPGVVRPTIAEAERLGVLALGALSALGRRMGTEWSADDLAGLLEGMLPEVQGRAVVGSDLTVVVLGSPAPQVVDLLDAIALRETRGQASTWRLTDASVRGALDAGHPADDILVALRGIAAGELPQPVEYLIQDVARRHGHLQVRSAGAVVVGSDEALLAEVAAHRSLRRLGLHAVAPTVLVAAVPAPDLLAALRTAGYLPVEVQVDGAPVVQVRRIADEAGEDGPDGDSRGPSGDESHTTVPDDDGSGEMEDDADAALARWVADLRGGDPSTEPRPPRPDRESPADVVARLLSGDLPPQRDEVAVLADTLRRTAKRLTATETDQLAHAVVFGLPVQIRYRSRSGGITVRAVSDLQVLDGTLFGWCHLREDARYFSLASVLGVAAATID